MLKKGKLKKVPKHWICTINCLISTKKCKGRWIIPKYQATSTHSPEQPIDWVTQGGMKTSSSKLAGLGSRWDCLAGGETTAVKCHQATERSQDTDKWT